MYLDTRFRIHIHFRMRIRRIQRTLSQGGVLLPFPSSGNKTQIHQELSSPEMNGEGGGTNSSYCLFQANVCNFLCFRTGVHDRVGVVQKNRSKGPGKKLLLPSPHGR